eukprot:m.606304 g.606304  ORF g.606304 m.606304 type:complete len:79 (-) comp22470_c0_seq19:2175-2411(-)
MFSVKMASTMLRRSALQVRSSQMMPTAWMSSDAHGGKGTGFENRERAAEKQYITEEEARKMKKAKEAREKEQADTNKK